MTALSQSTHTPRRGFWLKQLQRWHWISSSLSLVGMLVFAITGLTLNHAGDIPATPTTQHHEAQLPEALQQTLVSADKNRAPLPTAVSQWITQSLGVSTGQRMAEWYPDEVYVSMPRPGGDAWLAIDRHTGHLIYESTDRGWIAYLNDLHKGRNTGAAWRWFIDIFSVACVVFCLTGFCLLLLHARKRPLTWPLTGLGALVPILLALLFIH